jgi:hypothetical protein
MAQGVTVKITPIGIRCPPLVLPAADREISRIHREAMRPVLVHSKATGPAGWFCLRETTAVGNVVSVGGCLAACQLGHFAAAPPRYQKA